MEECIFCKIAGGEKENLVFEKGGVVAFNDINPKAPVHILIVPKNHIESIKSLDRGDVASKLIMVAREIADEKDLDGYKLIFNVGRKGGQVVDHLHLHLMGGWKNTGELDKFPA